MSLDPSTELALLETAYQNYITSGIASYTIGTDQGHRQVTKINILQLITRMDQLRAMVWREQNGMFQAANNRLPE
ncbi:MAG TPA: hypothetical protein VK797_23080 [Tepidisphaeraceae bacterium]|jgi:hypothetical protein|nr:hypothetical protein [Tepidisphaeraceae bacterium]